MDSEEDSWDAIDWDQKISEKKQPEEKVAEIKAIFHDDDESGNYFESNQAKRSQSSARKSPDKKIGKSSENYILPFSYNDLKEISSESEFHKVIFKVFGNFERYLMTHEEELSDDTLVELIRLNLLLLQIPFTYHNRLLINRLVQVESFWLQVSALIRAFYEKNCKDPRYMLLIDIKGFFENIEALLCWLIFHNYLTDSKMAAIIDGLISNIESSSDDELFINRLKEIKNFVNLPEDIGAFDVYPKLSDMQSPPDKLKKNVIKGTFLDVFHYLQVHLPLIKEDFVCQLRNGFDYLKSKSEVNRAEITPDVKITPNVRIEVIWQKVWNINCPLVIAKFTNHVHEIFNGQLVCFLSSRKNSNDFIVATVLRNSHLELLIPENSIIIEIISTENIEESIFDRSFVMIEPKSYFDPCLQTFQSLKCLQEHNFPFKSRILKLNKEPEIPNYEQQDYFSYKDYSFKLDSNWDNFDFGLEEMQLKALKASITNDFTLVLGPPGSGKSFIGIEIVKILLENTNERILVLTQTNNALDKFLIGCLKTTDKIARFGSQCKSKELLNFIVKRSIPHESKIYLKKLQVMQRDIVAKLIEEKAKPEDIFREISFHYRLTEEVNQLDTYFSVIDKRVFGMTTSFAAHNSTLTKMLKPSIVIVEEASEILESHVLASITKDTKQLIMIGDHHQLRPHTSSFEMQKKFNLDISLYERLIKNQFPHISLNVQMRMRPEFCDLIRTIYNHLRDGENVMSYPDVKGMKRNLFFLTHDHPESSSETSKENTFEVDFIFKVYRKLLSVGNTTDDIVILTPYIAQAKRFTDKQKELNLPKVRVAVLDSYQGEESKIILLSLVRSNKRNDIGFLSITNRICVLLSRAKIGFYICGNIECLSASKNKVWKDVKGILTMHKALGSEIPSDLVMTRNRLSSKN